MAIPNQPPDKIRASIPAVDALLFLHKMKTFLFILTAILVAPKLLYGNEARQVGYFRGLFEQDNEKYAVTISHDAPKDLKRNETIKYHITLEQGCQVYTGTTIYTPGRILISAVSIYVAEGSDTVGLGHFDLLQFQCDVDPQGVITKTRLILPDGSIHAMIHDTTASASEPKPAAEQVSTDQPAKAPESKSEGGEKPQPEAEGHSR